MKAVDINKKGGIVLERKTRRKNSKKRCKRKSVQSAGFQKEIRRNRQAQILSYGCRL